MYTSDSDCYTLPFTITCTRYACVPGEEVWKKLDSLRDQRKKIDNKINDSKKSGAGTDDVVKPTVWWYDLVEFLVRDTSTAYKTSNLEVSSWTQITSCCLFLRLCFSNSNQQ